MKNVLMCLSLLLILSPAAFAQTEKSAGMSADNPLTLIRAGQDQKEAIRIHESIFQATGFGNTFMVATPAGNVIIDTSLPFNG